MKAWRGQSERVLGNTGRLFAIGDLVSHLLSVTVANVMRPPAAIDDLISREGISGGLATAASSLSQVVPPPAPVLAADLTRLAQRVAATEGAVMRWRDVERGIRNLYESLLIRLELSPTR